MIEVLESVFTGLFYLLGILGIAFLVLMAFFVLKGALRAAAEELKREQQGKK